MFLSPGATRRLAVCMLATVTAAVATACSSSKGGNGSAATSTPTSTVTVSATASSSSSVAGSGTRTSNGNPPPGSATVRFGQSSLVALMDYSTQKINPVRLTLSLQAGSLSDLSGFTLDAQTKRSTPFYLTIKITNVGPSAVDSSGFAGRLTVDDASGDEVSSLTLLGDFAKCDGQIPDKLSPGASGQECDVYTAPQGERVTKASIDNGSSGNTITWS